MDYYFSIAFAYRIRQHLPYDQRDVNRCNGMHIKKIFIAKGEQLQIEEN